MIFIANFSFYDIKTMKKFQDAEKTCSWAKLKLASSAQLFDDDDELCGEWEKKEELADFG